MRVKENGRDKRDERKIMGRKREKIGNRKENESERKRRETNNEREEEEQRGLACYARKKDGRKEGRKEGIRIKREVEKGKKRKLCKREKGIEEENTI